ncbi:Protein of unknown function DUF58 [Agromyces sp. CF514]|uniref:DUF58 domain-containing protein n=1 Tax=Agromyces sp. CF514 TaxID=1881031 RepID=UPI0008EF4188|nr:DUF58 domain-containing protein [Agromyces sp. CF514]SFR87380.1 Protein of unknown function DUF58 [Agromyces sp. CF514]
MSLAETRTTMPEDARREGFLAAFIAHLVLAVGRLLGVLDDWRRAVASVVTARGWSVILGAVVAIVVGSSFGWMELIALGSGLAIVAAVASLWLLGRGASTIGLSLPVPRVVVGEPAQARLVAENPGRRRWGGVKLEVPVGRRVMEWVLPGLARGGSFDRSFRVPTDHRGIVPIGPARTVRADPLGLVRREIVWSEVAELHVHPRTVAIAALSSGFVRDLEGSPTRDLTASDISFHALREYLPGDDRRFIHWKSSAKTGTFMVRQFEETRRSRLMVVLDLDPEAYRDDAEFELAVSAAASVGARAIRDARTVSFVVSGVVVAPGQTRTSTSAARPQASPVRPGVALRRGGAMRRPQGLGPAGLVRELPIVTRDRLLDALCLIERDDRAAMLPDVASAAAESLPGVSLAFLVTGTGRGSAPLRAAASRLPMGVDAIAVQCAPEGDATVRTVAGLTVFGVGYLEDLRAMLARRASVA